MTSVTKTVRFDAAHLLTGYEGPCRNLHGHTYRVDVTVAGADGGDMVIDFRALKRQMNAAIVEKFDHAFLYWNESAVERAIAAAAEQNGLRTVALPFRTTSENLAHYFFDQLKNAVAGLESVRVWETSDNCAQYRGV